MSYTSRRIVFFSVPIINQDGYGEGEDTRHNKPTKTKRKVENVYSLSNKGLFKSVKGLLKINLQEHVRDFPFYSFEVINILLDNDDIV